MLCDLGWRVQRTLRQGLPCLLLWEGKGGQLLVLWGDIIPPALAPHCTVHPSFCTAGSINRAVQEQNKDQHLESDGCSCRGLWSCSSGAAASLSSSLLSTFSLIYNYSGVVQLNFFLLQPSQGFSPQLVSFQKLLPNHCFTSRVLVLTLPVPWKPFFHSLLLQFLTCCFAL